MENCTSERRVHVKYKHVSCACIYITCVMNFVVVGTWLISNLMITFMTCKNIKLANNNEINGLRWIKIYVPHIDVIILLYTYVDILFRPLFAKRLFQWTDKSSYRRGVSSDVILQDVFVGNIPKGIGKHNDSWKEFSPFVSTTRNHGRLVQ